MNYEQVAKIYKGSLLHVHYSAIVNGIKILKISCLHFRNNLVYDKKRKSLSLKFNNPQNYKFSRDNYESAKDVIINNKYDFRVLGAMFYGVIKHVKFFPYYMGMVIKNMEKQNIDHIEFRLRIGTHYMYNPHHEKQFISICEEIQMFYKYRDTFKSQKKSFVIIAQFSKCKNRHKVRQYFEDIINCIIDNKKYLKIIKGFDLSGDETDCGLLKNFEQDIIYLNNLMKKNKFIIPFIFHAGESKNVKTSISNLKFSLKYGSKRIGHGIYCVKDNEILKEIKNKKIMLELCPLSNIYLKNLESEDILKKILDEKLIISINSDDPNKLGERDLNDNFHYMINKLNLSKYDLKKIIKDTINYSLISEKKKKEMIKKINIYNI